MLAAAVSGAQPAARVCAAPPPTDAGVMDLAYTVGLPVDDHDLRMRRMRDSIAGTYIFVDVTTEGAGGARRLTESRLVIRPRMLISKTEKIGFYSHIIAEAEGVVLRSGNPSSRLQAVRDTARFFLAVSYNGDDRMALVPADPAFRDLIINDDPRPYYTVARIDEDGTMAGRWTSGGIAMNMFDTRAGRFAEFPAGYFCVFRLP